MLCALLSFYLIFFCFYQKIAFISERAALLSLLWLWMLFLQLLLLLLQLLLL